MSRFKGGNYIFAIEKMPEAKSVKSRLLPAVNIVFVVNWSVHDIDTHPGTLVLISRLKWNISRTVEQSTWRPGECRQCKELQETIKNLPYRMAYNWLLPFFHLHRTMKRLRALSLCIIGAISNTVYYYPPSKFKTTGPKVTCFLRKLWKGFWYTLANVQKHL